MKLHPVAPALLLLLMALPAAAAPPQALGFRLPEVVADAGNTITVDLEIVSSIAVDELAAAKFSVRVDPLLLTPVSVTRGDQLGAVPDQDFSFNLFADRVEVSLLTATPVTVDEGLFVSVTFDVHPLARPDEGCAIEMAGTGAQEIVLLETADAPPPGVKAAVTQGFFSVRDGLTCVQGDASVDGVVNTADAVLTLRIVAELLAEPSVAQSCGADANIDRDINAGDAVWILREVVGLPNDKIDRPLGTVVARWTRTATDPVLILEADGAVYGIDASFAHGPDVAWSGLGTPARGLRIERPRTAGHGVHWASGQPLTTGRLELDVPVGPDATVQVQSLVAYDAAGRGYPVQMAEDTVRGRAIRIAVPEVSNRPNPFNPSTSVHFTVPTAGPATLAIYDVRGQRVRTLRTGDLAAGDHRERWDGTDETGRPVASGVYYARLSTGTDHVSHRLLLLK